MRQVSDGDRSGIFFWILLALCAAFVWTSSGALPLTVASHFGAGGTANGFMPREAYRVFMLGTVILLPLLLFQLPKLLVHMPSGLINIPNRDHWLAGSRRAESLGYLARHLSWLAFFTMLFLCYVHGLVVLANREPSPHLAVLPMVAGLLAFLAAVSIWVWRLYHRFGKVA